MRLNLDQSRTVEITNQHPQFAGTEFAKEEFKVRVRPLTNSKMAEIRANNTTILSRGANFTNDAGVDKDHFVQTVQSWEGILDANGDPIPCTKENKEKVADVQWSFASRIISASMVESQKMVEKREEEAGN